MSGTIVVSAGWALFKKDGYGSALGSPVESGNDIRSEIIKLKSAGAGIIKVIASGIVSLNKPNTITSGGLDERQLYTAVREAQTLGLGVMCHANGEKAIIASAEAGVLSIEHGFFMTERALEVMARNCVYWVPTVGALARAVGSPKVLQDIQTHIKELIERHLRMIGRAHALGVPLAIGTDCVLPDPGYASAYNAELSYFEQAGLSRDAVMTIVGEGGAKLLGIDH